MTDAGHPALSVQARPDAAMGGRDSVGRLDRALAVAGETDRARVVAGNFRDLFGADPAA